MAVFFNGAIRKANRGPLSQAALKGGFFIHGAIRKANPGPLSESTPKGGLFNASARVNLEGGFSYPVRVERALPPSELEIDEADRRGQEIGHEHRYPYGQWSK